MARVFSDGPWSNLQNIIQMNKEAKEKSFRDSLDRVFNAAKFVEKTEAQRKLRDDYMDLLNKVKMKGDEDIDVSAYDALAGDLLDNSLDSSVLSEAEGDIDFDKELADLELMGDTGIDPDHLVGERNADDWDKAVYGYGEDSVEPEYFYLNSSGYHPWVKGKNRDVNHLYVMENGKYVDKGKSSDFFGRG